MIIEGIFVLMVFIGGILVGFKFTLKLISNKINNFPFIKVCIDEAMKELNQRHQEEIQAIKDRHHKIITQNEIDWWGRIGRWNMLRCTETHHVWENKVT